MNGEDPATDEALASMRMAVNHERVLDGQPPMLIEFPLTQQQIEWIAPHIEWATLCSHAGKPGMVLALVAQVGYPTGKMRIGARYIPNSVAETLKGPSAPV